MAYGKNFWFKLLVVLFYLRGTMEVESGKSQSAATKYCDPGFIPVNRSQFFDSDGDADKVVNMTVFCSWGMYPGLQCNQWSGFFKTDLSPYPYFKGFFAGNVSRLLGGWNLSYNSFGTGPLPERYAVYSDERTGILYSDCRNNKTNSAFSTSRCVDCSLPSPAVATILYLVLELFPVILLCLAVGFFNINLAHGFAHSFVFFYQMLPLVLAPLETFSSPGNFTLVYGKFLWGFVSLENGIVDATNVSALPCFAASQNPYFVRALEYAKPLCIAACTTALLPAALCAWCPGRPCRVAWLKVTRAVRAFKVKYACRGRVSAALASLCVLAYAALLRVSLSLLSVSVVYFFPPGNATFTAADLHSLSVPRYNGNVHYFSAQHRSYGSVAAVIAIASLAFPLLLICYPSLPQLYYKLRKKFILKRNALDSALSAFQITFKDNMSSFGGLYLLYRLVLGSVVAFCSEVSQRFFLVQLTLILIIAIHCLFRPFKDKRHNAVEMLHLLTLSVLQSLTEKAYNANYLSPVDTPGDRVALTVLVSLLSLLPLVGLAVCCLWGLFNRCRCYRREKVQTAVPRRRPPREMVNTLQGSLEASLGVSSGYDDDSETSSSDDWNENDELLT